MKLEHLWPNKNEICRYQNITWIHYLTDAKLRWSLLGLLVPLLVLSLFALSQAGTSLFLLTRFGFAHPVALLFASMVCCCLTSVYFQKISLYFKKTFFFEHRFYKAYKDLHRSFASVDFKKDNVTQNNIKRVQAMWLLLQHRHMVKKLRNMLKSTVIFDESDLEGWYGKMLERAMKDLGGEDFKIQLIDKKSFVYQWSLGILKVELEVVQLQSEKNLDDLSIKKIRNKLAMFGWCCLEGMSDSAKNNILEELKKIIDCNFEPWLNHIEKYEKEFNNGVLGLSEEETQSKPKSYQLWFNKFKHQRINIDHKLNPDPELYGFARYTSYFGGRGNMIAGNNLIGLYGSVAGVAALISFYPILHLSTFVKIVVALFGCCSAAYASYALTGPMLEKLLKQFSRWRMRQNFRRFLNKSSFQWLTQRSIDWRICICVIFAGFVTLSAVNFNVYATWHLTNRLIALFPDTVFAKFLSHMPIFIKIFLSGLQAIISFLCAGALYFTSCFNQYVGKQGKVNLRFISVLDKINSHIEQRSWLKVMQLIVIVTCSGLAAIAQTIIWFHGINIILFSLCSIPSTLAFFATFCEAALACLDNEDPNVWLSDEKIEAWVKHSSDMVNIFSEAPYQVGLNIEDPEENQPLDTNNVHKRR